MKKKLNLLLQLLFILGNLLTQLHAQNQCESGLVNCNLFTDNEHAPFLQGVASFDPTQNEVLLWTKITPATGVNEAAVYYELSNNESFTNVIYSGTIAATIETDFTVTVNIQNLESNTRYYYRFTDENGNASVIGKTKTLPSGDANHARLATVSCSSIYSGYFNAYRQIAESETFDAVLHLGDYLYDFVDVDEAVRIPDPYPTVPETLQEWRDRHTFYLLDPDLRAMRQNHPMFVIWDNHDVNEPGNPEVSQPSIQAFQEYVPMRLQQDETSKIYRKFELGNLVDLIMVDITTLRDLEEIAPNEPSVLGVEQNNWLQETLGNSASKWRVICNQKMMAGLYVGDLGPVLPIDTDGEVFDDKSWDGYMVERSQLFEYLYDNNINNNLVVSGDIHMSFVMDLAINPLDSLVYNPSTGEGCVGGEFISSSVTRGNIDEQTGLTSSINEFFADLIMSINPHHVYNEFFSHGYGIVDIKPDSLVAEFWYCPKLEVSNEQTFAAAYVMRNNENHWNRDTLLTPTPATLNINIITATNTLPEPQSISVSPNPSNNFITIETNQKGKLSIFNVEGKLMFEQLIQSGTKTLDISQWANGEYLLQLSNNKKEVLKVSKFVKG